MQNESIVAYLSVRSLLHSHPTFWEMLHMHRERRRSNYSLMRFEVRFHGAVGRWLSLRDGIFKHWHKRIFGRRYYDCRQKRNSVWSHAVNLWMKFYFNQNTLNSQSKIIERSHNQSNTHLPLEQNPDFGICRYCRNQKEERQVEEEWTVLEAEVGADVSLMVVVPVELVPVRIQDSRDHHPTMSSPFEKSENSKK